MSSVPLRRRAALRTVLHPGDPLPDITLLDPDGEPVSLARTANEHMLLIFLRHLT